jgi:hypothetical protein
MSIDVLGIDPGTYEAHPLHRSARSWTETNCYVDLWIEILHALGCDPLAAASFTFGSDFEGDQWTMFKFPPADLWTLFGIQVAELNVWLPLVDHVAEQLGFGRLLTVDVDAWFLPDTEGVTYRSGHQKTTLTPQMLDLERRRLGYFHNAGYFEIDGEDFDGVLRSGSHEDPPEILPPYTEVINLDRLRPGEPALDEVIAILRGHLARRPETNPVVRFQERLERDLPWIATQDMATFHRYAFGTCRQCGANAELAGAFVAWLDPRDGGGLGEIAERFETISDVAKSLQFSLARVPRGRIVDVGAPLEKMASAWDDAMDRLARRYG